jgi:nucleotide-binding universal stress UspA family protein
LHGGGRRFDPGILHLLAPAIDWFRRAVMVFTRICVATDGTEASLRALDLAAQIAGRYSAELLVVTAVSVPEWVARRNMEYGGVEAYVEANALRAFEPVVALLKRAGVGAELKVVVGPAPDTLLAEIERSSADLVIMGRRSRDEPKDFVLGSVSDRVARHVKVPILLVP